LAGERVPDAHLLHNIVIESGPLKLHFEAVLQHCKTAFSMLEK
jgi:hypothetical protein